MLALMMGSTLSKRIRMSNETLYFGRNRRNAPVITEKEWDAFRHDVVDPKIEGYTWWNAHGIWQGTNEDTFVLSALGADPRAIDAIAQEYCERFDQDAVARTESPVELSFVSRLEKAA
jgi:hypothetical protein